MDYQINPQMLETIFENRNHQYGAYELRANYEKRLKQSFLYCMIFIGGILSIGLLSDQTAPALKSVIAGTQGQENITKDIIELLKDWNKPQPPPSSANGVPVIVPNREVTFQRNDTLAAASINNNGAGNSLSGIGPKNGNNNNGTDITNFRIPSLPKPQRNATRVPDKMPEFPGGIDALHRYLDEHIDREIQPEVDTKTIIQFVVGEDGEISGVEIVVDAGLGNSDKIIKVIAGMPNWIPGKVAGEPISVIFRLPITFAASE